MKIELNSKKLDYTCENNKFKTNIEIGYKHHKKHNYKGSALPKPVYESNTYSLWLEHVIEVKTPDNKIFWFMWYDDKTGNPIIPMSAVFSKDELLAVFNNINIKDIDFE